MGDIYIYEKNKDSLAFLKKFFKANAKAHSARFFTRITDLKKKLANSAPDILVTGAPGYLGKIAPHAGNTPILGILSPSLPDGMREIIDNNIEHYVLPPYQTYDIKCKLGILGRKSSNLDLMTQEKRDLETIVELTDMLSSTMDPEEVLYLIVRKISELIPVSRCSVISVPSAKGTKAEVISSFERRDISHLTLDLRKYPEIRKALRTRKTVTISDALSDPLMKPVKKTISKLDIKSIMVIPVFFRTEVIGTLFLRTSSRSYAFTPRERKLCQQIANTAAKALNNAYLFQEMNTHRAELEKLAITDYLTGLYNIRYLYHRLESEFSTARRYKTPLSCIMFDIDHFKKVNDTYGHRTGDIVLREFANLIKEYSRQSDVLARYGGEEFILLLPQTNMVGAISEAKRLGEVVRAHKFKDLKKKAKITISLGVSAYPYHKKIKTQDDLIRLADDALLTAKKKGRDRALVHE